MARVKFLTDYTVQDEHEKTDKATRYKAGKVYDMTEAKALRWVGRGRAQVLAQPEPKAKPVKAPSAKK